MPAHRERAAVVLELMNDPLLLFMVFLAAVIVGVSKSGLLVSLGASAVPILAFVMPARDAAGLLLPVILAGDAVALWVYRREVNWRVIWQLLPACLIGTIAGWVFFAFVSEALVRVIIGTVTLLFVIDATFAIRTKIDDGSGSRATGIFWGAVTGFTSFISHTGGPPYQIYVLPMRLPPRLYAGTTAIFFAAMNFAKLGPYYLLDQLSPVNMAFALAAIPIALLSMLGGIYVVKRIEPRLFYGVAYALLFVLSVSLLWQGATALF